MLTGFLVSQGICVGDHSRLNEKDDSDVCTQGSTNNIPTTQPSPLLRAIQSNWEDHKIWSHPCSSCRWFQRDTDEDFINAYIKNPILIYDQLYRYYARMYMYTYMYLFIVHVMQCLIDWSSDNMNVLTTNTITRCIFDSLLPDVSRAVSMYESKGSRLDLTSLIWNTYIVWLSRIGQWTQGTNGIKVFTFTWRVFSVEFAVSRHYEDHTCNSHPITKIRFLSSLTI